MGKQTVGSEFRLGFAHAHQSRREILFIDLRRILQHVAIEGKFSGIAQKALFYVLEVAKDILKRLLLFLPFQQRAVKFAELLSLFHPWSKSQVMRQSPRFGIEHIDPLIVIAVLAPRILADEFIQVD